MNIHEVKRQISRWWRQARTGVAKNKAVAVMCVLVVIQMPLTIRAFIGHDEVQSPPTPPASPPVAQEKPEPQPPLFPYRQDPFAPFPGQSVPAASPEQSEQTEEELPGMARIAGYPGADMPPMGPWEEAGMKGRPNARPGLLAASRPVEALPPMKIASVAKPAEIRSKPAVLQGVINFGNSRLAVFRSESGDVIYVRPTERVPESDLVVKSVLEDGVLVVDSSKAKSKAMKMLVGKGTDKT